jgi:hypothetical protein
VRVRAYEVRVCGAERGDVVGQDHGLGGQRELREVAQPGLLAGGYSSVQHHEVLQQQCQPEQDNVHSFTHHITSKHDERRASEDMRACVRACVRTRYPAEY